MLQRIRRYPLCTACLLFLAVSAVAIFLPAIAKTAGAVLCALLLLIVLLSKRLRTKLPCTAIALSLLFCVAALLLSHAFWNVNRDEARKWIGEEPCTAEAVVRRVETPAFSLQALTLDLYTLDGTPVSFRASLLLYGDSGLHEGDRIRAKLIFSDIGASLDEAAYSLSDGIMLSAALPENETVSVIGQEGGIYGAYAALQRVRRTLCNTVSYLYPKEAASFLSALLFGQRDTLDAAVTRDFRALGISHILAISGLHLSILTGLAQLLLRRFLSPRASAPILIVLIWLFAAMLTFPPSIVRAAVMLTFVHLSDLFLRDSDPLTSLSAAGALIVAISPGALVDLSFQLSFFAALGLCVAGIPLGQAIRQRFSGKRPVQKILRYTLTALSTTFCAVLFTLPILFFSLGSVSAVCLPMSLLFLPPVTLLLMLAPISLLLFRIPLLGVLSVRLTGALASLLLAAARFFGRYCSLTLSLRYAFVFPLTLLTVMGIVFILRRKRRYLLRFAALLTAVTVLYFVCLSVHLFRERDVWYFDYINEGQSDAIALHNTSFRMLCDLSDGGYTTLSLAAERLEGGSGIDRIDVLLLTHYGTRHVTSFARLAAAHRVGTLCLPAPKGEREEAICRQLERIAAENGCTAVRFAAEPTAALTFGGVTVTLAAPLYLDRSAKPLISLALEVGDARIFYAGSSAFSTLQPVFFSLFDSADLLICGAYGPAVHKDFTPEDAIAKLGGIVCASDAVRAHLRTALPVCAQNVSVRIGKSAP